MKSLNKTILKLFIEEGHGIACNTERERDIFFELLKSKNIIWYSGSSIDSRSDGYEFVVPKLYALDTPYKESKEGNQAILLCGEVNFSGIQKNDFTSLLF